MKVLRKLNAEDLAKLMKLSDSLSELNWKRNKAWKKTHDAGNSKQAVYAFQGDVYQGLSVDDMNATEVKRCQKHVRILSGLYGMLRPLDLIQPYRLEMGTKLSTPKAKDLYGFWGETVSNAIAAELSNQKSNLVINLASNEYSKVAKLKQLDATVVTPAFRDWKNGEYKMISFFAKRARGAMTRYLIQSGARTTEDVNGFDLDGYSFSEKLSKENQPVFTRRQAK